MATLAENLRRLREAKGMSQSALAKKAKVTQQLISQLESPNSDKKTTKLPELAAALGVGVHQIDESYPVATDGFSVVELPTDGPDRLLLQYKFLGDPDPSDPELIDWLAKSTPAERQEFLLLLRHRHGATSKP